MRVASELQSWKCIIEVPCRAAVRYVVHLTVKMWSVRGFNPLHLNISMHILQTFLLALLILLTRRICQTIKASQVGDHFLYSHDLNV